MTTSISQWRLKYTSKARIPQWLTTYRLVIIDLSPCHIVLFPNSITTTQHDTTWLAMGSSPTWQTISPCQDGQSPCNILMGSWKVWDKAITSTWACHWQVADRPAGKIQERNLWQVMLYRDSLMESGNCVTTATYRLLLSLVHCLCWKYTTSNSHRFCIDVHVPAFQPLSCCLISVTQPQHLTWHGNKI